MHEVHLPRAAVAPASSADTIVDAERRALDRARSDLTVALERRRRELERALHDGAQQHLLALRMAILRTAADPPLSGQHTAEVAATLVDRLDGVIDDLRRLASGGRPRSFDAGDFLAGLHELAAISGADTVVLAPPSIELDVASAELCAFVVSEALANACRHSEATRFVVQVEQTADGLRIDVIDNGRGGATVVPGRGIEGLSRRADAMGGTLEILSDGSGTDVRLHLPLPTQPTAEAVPSTTTARPGGAPPIGVGEELGRLTGAVVQVWFWCGDDGLAARAPEAATWRDERGRPVDPATGHGSDRDSVRVLAGGRAVATLVTDGDARLLAGICREHAPLLVDGREQAIAAQRLELLRREHARIARRAGSLESALLRRLTDRPCEELHVARACLLDTGGRRWIEAAEHVGGSTDLLREIVRRLRVPDDGSDAAPSLTIRLQGVARRARVRLDVEVDDIDGADDEQVVSLVESVAEEVMLDAAPRSEVIVRVRTRARSVHASILLERLPSPVAVALVEELALAAHSKVSIQPSAHGVRIVLEVPCVS